MLRIFKNLKPWEWLYILSAIAFVTIQVWLDLKLPDYTSEITRLVLTEGSKMADIWITGGKMLSSALGSLIATVIVGFLVARMAATLSYRLRNRLYDRVNAFSMEEIGHFSTSSLITRTTNDITQIQMFVSMGLQVMIKAPITATWAIVKISGKSWQWTAATAITVVVLVTITLSIVVFVMPKFKLIQSLTDRLNLVTRENLTGVRVVRAYNAEKYQEEKFETVNARLTGTNLFVNRTMALMMPGMYLMMNGLSLSIFWIGAHLIQRASMLEKIDLYRDMIVFSSYAMQVVMSFMMLIFIFVILPRATVSAKRINEVLDTEPKILDGEEEISAARGEVEFKNVSFKYPNAADYVLFDVSFRAAPGETVAIIGSTGSGKSTLINLISRFYDVSEGQILIDGVDIRNYKQSDLRGIIGYVPQRAVIFSGTVASNIAFGDNSRKMSGSEELAVAASVAQAEEFIEKMPLKYDASISQGGINLSGGQKQRLSIARAIARQPKIFIFDDSFSALDYKTDRLLRQRLAGHTSDATTFIVAQRIGTIRNADKIIVLDSGRVAGIGKHDQLLKSCEVYREIALSQLSKEELSDE
ncbi:MAG: ABC transporter ATP-binding protein [Clostridiales bacterium]|nr:ABC transporter ATP-binding protein [Clostridiales bacterium]